MCAQHVKSLIIFKSSVYSSSFVTMPPRSSEIEVIAKCRQRFTTSSWCKSENSFFSQNTINFVSKQKYTTYAHSTPCQIETGGQISSVAYALKRIWIYYQIIKILFWKYSAYFFRISLKIRLERKNRFQNEEKKNKENKKKIKNYYIELKKIWTFTKNLSNEIIHIPYLSTCGQNPICGEIWVLWKSKIRRMYCISNEYQTSFPEIINSVDRLSRKHSSIHYIPGSIVVKNNIIPNGALFGRPKGATRWLRM